MHRSLKLTAAVIVAFVAVVVPAHGARAGGQAADCDPRTGKCTIEVVTPPTPGTGGGGGSGGRNECLRGGTPVSCTSSGGTWSNQLQCYLSLASPQPPLTDPVWAGHTDGAVYWCTTNQGLAPTSRQVWLAAPPAGPTPEELARRALDSLTIPRPVMRRSPSESNTDAGVPYTWVNLWTWVWTDPASWTPLSARAAAGAVWAEVAVTPAQLSFTPGDGSAAVACPGPGRPWREVDGNAAPTAGGCGFRYGRVSAAPVTATLSIEWTVTWRGSGGTGGTMPAMQSQASSSFVVEQIQVVTR